MEGVRVVTVPSPVISPVTSQPTHLTGCASRCTPSPLKPTLTGSPSTACSLKWSLQGMPLAWQADTQPWTASALKDHREPGVRNGQMAQQF